LAVTRCSECGGLFQEAPAAHDARPAFSGLEADGAVAVFVLDARRQADAVKRFMKGFGGSSSTFAIFFTSHSPVATSMAAATGGTPAV